MGVKIVLLLLGINSLWDSVVIYGALLDGFFHFCESALVYNKHIKWSTSCGTGLPEGTTIWPR